MAALKGKALIAYLIVCVFWGSTYLAIKIGVSDLPPFLFAGLRFMVAGLILLALARALGDPLPRKSDWRTLASWACYCSRAATRSSCGRSSTSGRGSRAFSS
jgi:drug/metabolite transporter (DMT)-like permease